MTNPTPDDKTVARDQLADLLNEDLALVPEYVEDLCLAVVK